MTTFLLQAGALAAHGCFQPSSVPGGCELFIAVWAFQNTSYTLLARCVATA